MSVLNVQSLTERCDVDEHEVASLRDNRSHADIFNDGGHAVPLALQFLSQWSEVALWLTHQLKVPEQTLCHGLLRKQPEVSDYKYNEIILCFL